MSRTKGAKGKHNKEKHVKEKKKRGRPSKQHQKQYQHQTVNVNVNGGGDDSSRKSQIPAQIPSYIFDPSLINPHYGINDRQPVNPPTNSNPDMITPLLQAMIANQKQNQQQQIIAQPTQPTQQPTQPIPVKPKPQPIPQPIPQEPQNTGIVQNIPEMASGGDVGYDDELINDFCMTNLIELANELQSVKYYVTHRFKETDFESKNYKGRLVIVFKESASVNVIESITKFVERAEDCHHLFEQSVNVSGSEPNSISINLLSDKFSDREFGKGGKVYDYAPKKINLAKTKKITTHIGDFNLGLITNDFVYFVNVEEGDDNGNTIMYNKNGELLSDNIHATNDLFETLENQSKFEFIHPDLEKYRQEILKGN